MSTFRAALRVAARHRLYFFIYLACLSLLGVFLLILPASGQSGSHETFDASVAVIDRDGSEVSTGLARRMDATANLVSLDDDERAIQDALAQSTVDAVIVVPEGFGESLMRAAREGAGVPDVQVAYGTNTLSGALAANEATSWLSLVARAAALDGADDQDAAVRAADSAVDAQATVTVADVGAAEGGASRFASYLGYNTYSLFVTIVVCVGLVMSRFRDQRVRERCDVSPQRPRRLNGGALAAGAVLALGAWAWVALVGMVFGGDVLHDASAGQVAVGLAAMLAYCLTPLALAFALSRLNSGEQLLNAVGNIAGLACMFFGGNLMPLEMMGSGVQAFALFTPGYWFIDALDDAFATRDLAAVAGRLGTDFAMLALFAVVTALIGFAVARARTQRAVGSARLASRAV